MDFRSCKKIHEMFALDEKLEPFLQVRDVEGNLIKKVYIAEPTHKAYIYASMYFYDEVIREVEKLRGIIYKIKGEIKMEVAIEEPVRLFLELSNRVRCRIGDDSLDAFIKEILSDKIERNLTFLPTDTELNRFLKVKQSLYTELFDTFVDLFFGKVKDASQQVVKIPIKYVDTMTDRQRNLFQPALKTAGLISRLRLDRLEMKPDFSMVAFIPVALNTSFDEKEEEIKNALKKMMEEYCSFLGNKVGMKPASAAVPAPVEASEAPVKQDDADSTDGGSSEASASDVNAEDDGW